ncbi:hypothetical protein PA25_35650 [Pseudoalteromonas sp. A25]|uniref:hypothetical protein n=1 Tax=Pseudoalteromonas sp. A25 TaxID=116092 RepID=UPI001260D49C|nr:hypothetical protein [Pseudoalteromonas sp. A25]BBN83580.1 hypothetical protein PA25_35650 [Pseudoalteromonas sp. A25]
MKSLLLFIACTSVQAIGFEADEDFAELFGEAPTSNSQVSGVFEANLVSVDTPLQNSWGSNQFARLEYQHKQDDNVWVMHTQLDFDYLEDGSLLSLFAKQPVADRALDLDWQERHDRQLWYAQVDWAYWQRAFNNASITVGRQPVTVGLGRLFSPLDPLGAFNVFDLDRLYKSGVDAIKLDYFVSDTMQTQSILTVNQNDKLQGLQTIKGNLEQGVWLLSAAIREEQHYISASLQRYQAWLDADVYGELLYGDLTSSAQAQFTTSQQKRALLGMSTKVGANGSLTFEFLYQSLAADEQTDYRLWQQRYAHSQITPMGLAKRYMALSYSNEWRDLTRYELLAMHNLVDSHSTLSAVVTHSASDNLQLRLALAWTPKQGIRNSEFEQFADLLQLGIRYYF